MNTYRRLPSLLCKSFPFLASAATLMRLSCIEATAVNLFNVKSLKLPDSLLLFFESSLHVKGLVN